jgi:hypothetical protein
MIHPANELAAVGNFSLFPAPFVGPAMSNWLCFFKSLCQLVWFLSQWLAYLDQKHVTVDSSPKTGFN